MEPISIFAAIGLAVFALSVKHFMDNCKTSESENDEVALVDDEIPPKYEEIYNN